MRRIEVTHKDEQGNVTFIDKKKSGSKVKKCQLCEIGHPLKGNYHIPTQRFGMIPVTRCLKTVTNEESVKKKNNGHRFFIRIYEDCVIIDRDDSPIVNELKDTIIKKGLIYSGWIEPNNFMKMNMRFEKSAFER